MVFRTVINLKSMKRRNKKFIAASFLSAMILLVWSCGDEKEFFTDISPSSGTKIKFIHAASDAAGVNFFVDGVKVSAAGTSIVPATQAVNIGSIAYQGTFPGTNYVTLPGTSLVEMIVPTLYKADDTIASQTILSKEIITTSEANYTIAFVGITGAFDAILIEDDLSVAPTNEKAFVKFANFIHNSTDKLTLKATPPVTTDNPTPTPIILAQNVGYTEASSFIELPVTGLYTNVRIHNAVTDAVVATLVAGSSTFTGNNVYTIFARGQIGGTGTKVPGVTRVIDR